MVFPSIATTERFSCSISSQSYRHSDSSAGFSRSNSRRKVSLSGILPEMYAAILHVRAPLHIVVAFAAPDHRTQADYDDIVQFMTDVSAAYTTRVCYGGLCFFLVCLFYGFIISFLLEKVNAVAVEYFCPRGRGSACFSSIFRAYSPRSINPARSSSGRSRL